MVSSPSTRLIILIVVGIANAIQSSFCLLVLLGSNFNAYQGWISNLLWFVPILSFPNFLAYLKFQRFGAAMAWLIALCILAHYFDFGADIAHQPRSVTDFGSFARVLLGCVILLLIPAGMQVVPERAHNRSPAVI
jgi:hypothetical protein